MKHLSIRFLAKYYNEDFVNGTSVCENPLDIAYEKMTRDKDGIRHLMFEEIQKYRPYAEYPDDQPRRSKHRSPNKFASMFGHRRSLSK